MTHTFFMGLRLDLEKVIITKITQKYSGNICQKIRRVNAKQNHRYSIIGIREIKQIRI